MDLDGIILVAAIAPILLGIAGAIWWQVRYAPPAEPPDAERDAYEFWAIR